MSQEYLQIADKLITMLVGLVTGFIGYWFTTFWMKPILRYRELRSSILSDFRFYAQVINAEGLNERMQALYERRVEPNRKNSAELSACLLELPKWYLWWLHGRGYKPERVQSGLIGYSNTTAYEDANRIEKKIREDLGLPTNEES